MQVVITLAGRGQRFSDQGFYEPKPIIPVAGRPAIYYLIDSLAPDWALSFVLAEHDRDSQLEKIIKQKVPQAKVIYTPFSERGPIDTVLAALPLLNSQEPVLVSYCDLALVWDSFDFVKKAAGFEMASVNYQGFHPTYLGPNSYCHVRVDSKTGLICELQEKILFTDEIEKEITSAGVYYFKNKEILSLALQQQLQQDLKFKKEFYVSLALQAALNKNSDLRILDYRVSEVVQFGTPADVERFDFWLRYLSGEQPPQKLKHIEEDKSPLNFNPEIFEKEKLYWQKIFNYFELLKN